MIQSLRKILGREYYPINRITISKNDLISSYKYLSHLNKNIKIAPVLKSNAYGHGINTVAKILDELNPPFFCVDSLFEAYELFKEKIKSDILIMGYVRPENLRIKILPFSYAIYDLDLAEAINEYQPGAKIHIKVDTGMHRLGVPVKDLRDFVKKLKRFKYLNIEGLMSHLADPLNANTTGKQLTSFEDASAILDSEGFELKYKHIAASGGLLKIDKSRLSKISNLSRAGIALYGLSPLGKNPQLKPALQFSSIIGQIKKLTKGDKVGYSGTFTSSKNMLLGILPAGYFDGVDRRLSNKGIVLVDGKQCPIIGRVSMNITTIDLTNVKNPKVGQEAIVYSSERKNLNSVENTAKLCETIPHEILIHLKSTIRREII